jgi:hypothetical protein
MFYSSSKNKEKDKKEKKRDKMASGIKAQAPSTRPQCLTHIPGTAPLGRIRWTANPPLGISAALFPYCKS